MADNNISDSNTRVFKRFEQLRTARNQLERDWSGVSHLIASQSLDFNMVSDPNLISRKLTKPNLLDSTARSNSILLSNALNGLLVENKNRFFQFEKLDDSAGNDWLENAETISHAEISKSNFRLEMAAFYNDFVNYGTANLFLNPAFPLDYKTIALDKYIVDWDKNTNKVIAVYRVLVHENPVTNKTEQLLNLVVKVDDVYESRLYSFKNKVLLSAERFKYMPFSIARFFINSAGFYGDSPGQQALPDTRTLNKAVDLNLRGWSSDILPPLLKPENMGKIDRRPGAENSVRRNDIELIRPLINNKGRKASENLLQLNDIRNSIKGMFFVDKLQLKEQSRKTAIEAQLEIQLLQEFLSPTISALEIELFKPVILKTIDVLEVAEILPPRPESLQGVDLDLQLVGSLASLQKNSVLGGLSKWIESIASFSQLFPEAKDFINESKVVPAMGLALNVPSEFINSERDVTKLRQARAKAQQAALEAEQNAQNEKT